MDFFNLPVTNAYNNLTAISIRIASPASKGIKSVLVNAHFDSVFGTTGEALLAETTCADDNGCFSAASPCHTCLALKTPGLTLRWHYGQVEVSRKMLHACATDLTFTRA